MDSSAAAGLLAEAQLVVGRATPAECHVFARLTVPGHKGLRLAGRIEGPYCAFAHTLASSATFVSQEAGEFTVAEAIVTEPCFWTADMPHQYRATLELWDGSQRIAQRERFLGIRPLTAKGRALVWEGKGWVVRAVRREAVIETDLSAWRDAAAAMYAIVPDDALCQEASRLGVILLAELPPGESLKKHAARLACCPAVAALVVPRGTELPKDARHIAPNTLWGEWIGGPKEAATDAGGDILLVKIDEARETLAAMGKVESPLIAMRPLSGQMSVAEARRECDRLQADLAGKHSWAGYIV